MNFSEIPKNKKGCIDGSKIDFNKVNMEKLVNYLVYSDKDYQKHIEYNSEDVDWKEIAEDLEYVFCKTCYSWVKNFKQHCKTKKHGRNLINSLNINLSHCNI